MNDLTVNFPPNIKELHKYSSIKLRKKRMIKKFYNSLQTYIPRKIYLEYLGLCFATPLVRQMYPRNLQIKEIIKNNTENCTYSLMTKF